MKLLTAKEVAKLINRHPSTINSYVGLHLLPHHICIEKNTRRKMWNKVEVLKCIPKITKYQKENNRPYRTTKNNNKTTNYSELSKIANNSFNLCLGDCNEKNR